MRHISKEKLRQYQSENFLRAYAKMIDKLAREEAEEERRRRKRYGYDSDEDDYNYEDDFDFEDYFGMSEEQWYNCYDPSD